MQNPLQITYHDLDNSSEIDALIKEKFEKVLTMNPELTKCHVTLEKLSKHHQKSDMASVTLDLKIAHFDDIVIEEKCMAIKDSLKTTILKVFKLGLDLSHKHKQKRMDQKRSPLADLQPVESVE